MLSRSFFLSGIALATFYFFCSAQAVTALPLPSNQTTHLHIALASNQTTPNSRTLLRESYITWLPLYLLTSIGVIILYQQNCYLRRRNRIEQAQMTMKDFNSNPVIQKVMSILDFEEYAPQYYEDPITKETKKIDVTDDLVRQSLRSHDDMVLIKYGLSNLDHDVFKDLSGPNCIKKQQDQPTTYRAKLIEYRDEIYPAQIQLRHWFNTFLWGLEDINAAIESHCFTPSELKPFIEYWIQVIADRSMRRKGGSSFYDSLYNYIYKSGFTGVQTLFNRYGYCILPPPYEISDLKVFDGTSNRQATSQLGRENSQHKEQSPFDFGQALACAKISMLAYEDQNYVQDIGKLWSGCQHQSNHEESQEKSLSEQEENIARAKKLIEVDIYGKTEEGVKIKLFENKKRDTHDTQAILISKSICASNSGIGQSTMVILAFRGTENIKDWSTNLDRHQILFDPQASAKIKIHRGFQESLDTIWADIEEELKGLSNADLKLWITGHSLGGALAALAAAKIKYKAEHECEVFKKIDLRNVYTYGQPRIGNLNFGRQADDLLYDKTKSETIYWRYVNNNDIVPRVPIPLLHPWRPYFHFGKCIYISFSGFVKDDKISPHIYNTIDRIRGSIRSFLTTGRPDSIADHDIDQYVANIKKSCDKRRDGNFSFNWRLLLPGR